MSLIRPLHFLSLFIPFSEAGIHKKNPIRVFSNFGIAQAAVFIPFREVFVWGVLFETCPKPTGTVAGIILMSPFGIVIHNKAPDGVAIKDHIPGQQIIQFQRANFHDKKIAVKRLSFLTIISRESRRAKTDQG